MHFDNVVVNNSIKPINVENTSSHFYIFLHVLPTIAFVEFESHVPLQQIIMFYNFMIEMEYCTMCMCSVIDIIDVGAAYATFVVDFVLINVRWFALGIVWGARSGSSSSKCCIRSILMMLVNVFFFTFNICSSSLVSFGSFSWKSIKNILSPILSLLHMLHL